MYMRMVPRPIIPDSKEKRSGVVLNDDENVVGESIASRKIAKGVQDDMQEEEDMKQPPGDEDKGQGNLYKQVDDRAIATKTNVAEFTRIAKQAETKTNYKGQLEQTPSRFLAELQVRKASFNLKQSPAPKNKDRVGQQEPISAEDLHRQYLREQAEIRAWLQADNQKLTKQEGRAKEARVKGIEDDNNSAVSLWYDTPPKLLSRPPQNVDIALT